MSREVISADEVDLLSFFEVQPEMQDDSPWPYTDALYRVVQGEETLTCAIAPAYKDVRIIISRRELVFYELNAMGVDDIKYHRERDREALEIVLSEQESIWLRIKPSIEIRQHVSGE